MSSILVCSGRQAKRAGSKGELQTSHFDGPEVGRSASGRFLVIAIGVFAVAGRATVPTLIQTKRRGCDVGRARAQRFDRDFLPKQSGLEAPAYSVMNKGGKPWLNTQT